MRRRSRLKPVVFVAVVLFLAAFPARCGAQLQKSPNHLYICTFNVYKLGSVDVKYTSPDEETDPGSTPSTSAIPQRIKNLANVLAEGPFDLVVFQEVTHGERGMAAMADLAKELKDQHNLDYLFFMSGYIGQGVLVKGQ